ncbi:SAM-dependent methyltransferase [Nonomuraea thailandensis]
MDPAKPSGARVYDCLLDGRDNFAADRAAAATLLERASDLKKSVRDNREFRNRVVKTAIQCLPRSQLRVTCSPERLRDRGGQDPPGARRVRRSRPHGRHPRAGTAGRG